MRQRECIIMVLQRIVKRMIFVEKTVEQHHADWNKKFLLTNEQIEELVQAKLDRMHYYRQHVDKDEFYDLL